MSNLSASAAAHYEKALSLGQKQGGSPAVLQDILRTDGLSSPAELSLGVIQIPLDQIAGTYDGGRSSAFSAGFYPLLEKGSEFSAKWIELCRAHLEEGISTPVKAYEYLGLYYILEGNKRVSVLSYFDAVSIAGEVIRIIPPISTREAVRVNYEYFDFYANTGINYIYFRHPGSFYRLARLARPENRHSWQSWSEEEVTSFSSAYVRFRGEYTRLCGRQSHVDISEAMLSFLSLYGMDALSKMPLSELKQRMQKLTPMWTAVLKGSGSALSLDPSSEADAIPTGSAERTDFISPGLAVMSDTVKSGISGMSALLRGLFPESGPELQVSFIHNRRAEESGWTFSHETARMHLDHSFVGRITSRERSDVGLENISEVLQEEIDAGSRLIFTTSSLFLKDSVTAALDHPGVRILNCSLNKPHPAVRTYAARMYEAKFLMGAIAASLSDNGRLAFVADFPIYGTIAEINAFAAGAQMIRPDAKVFLNWSKIDGINIDSFLWENELSIICGKNSDIGMNDRRYGLYRIKDGNIWNIAAPVWNWSVFYEKITSQILNGSYRQDTSGGSTGISYWWGFSSGMVGLIYSRKLLTGTLRLIKALRDGVSAGSVRPFDGPLTMQDGSVIRRLNETLDPGDIISMNWLAENVIGSIPPASSLVTDARILADFQGVRTEENLI